jgi:hypothetical protein
LFPALDPACVLAVTLKPLFPVVQLEAPLLAPAGFAVLLLVPAGFAAEALAVVSALEEVALGLCWFTACCPCAIPAQSKTIAAKIAIKNALPVLAPLMV